MLNGCLRSNEPGLRDERCNRLPRVLVIRLSRSIVLFRGTRFLGWASIHAAIHVAVHGGGHAIRVVYGVYSGNDPFCCPHATRTIAYRWNGSRIVASGTPPREYGRRGPKLHLAAA